MPSKNLIDRRISLRVLISVAPVLYRETIAHALRRHRQHLDVRTAAPVDLEKEVAHFEPHLVFCNQATAKVRESVPSWVEVAYEDSIVAAACLHGEDSKINDISTSDLLSIVDRSKARLS
jgi:hypothetical protein